MVAEDGFNMEYDVGANLRPQQAYDQKIGNCLSFTLLLSRLAAELDMNIKFNQVDIPNLWGMDEHNEFVLYRHINGVLNEDLDHIVFDLAIDRYDLGYPQRIISRQYAVAQLHSNRAIDALKTGDLESAYHLVRLAVSMAPRKADLWVNLGVILKRKDLRGLAEFSFLRAYQLSPSNRTAASNLERLYLENGQTNLAKKFERSAMKAKRQNPYYHFSRAKKFYMDDQLFKSARAISRAIKLHDSDPRFFELAGRIDQKRGKLKKAYAHLRKAYELSSNSDQRGKYAGKMRSVIEKAKQQNPRDGVYRPGFERGYGRDLGW